MSLASILLRSRLSSAVINSPPITPWQLLPRAVVGSFSSMLFNNNNNINNIRSSGRRSVWSEVIRQVPSDDPSKAGQLTFEDPDLADTRMLRAVRSEGKRHIVCI